MVAKPMAERIPPLYALRAFEVAARSSSFTRAAEELSLTQSAISRHVRTLEEALGCRLFERKGSRLSLSDEGRRLSAELKEGFRIIEEACQPFTGQRASVRLKAPPTLTIRWLLQALYAFEKQTPVQLSSVWMDVDSVDFNAEPYDCAILLGNGHFGTGVQSCKLFDEWLVPVACSTFAPDQHVRDCALIHPSTDRRDWRRWLKRMGLTDSVRLDQGKVFDTLDQGIAAATRGHGVSIGDVFLIADEVRLGHIQLPWPSAVATGDAYYLAWRHGSLKQRNIFQLRDCLLEQLPDVSSLQLEFLPHC